MVHHFNMFFSIILFITDHTVYVRVMVACDPWCVTDISFFCSLFLVSFHTIHCEYYVINI